MTPIAKFRWLVIVGPSISQLQAHPSYTEIPRHRFTVRVLQQWWEITTHDTHGMTTYTQGEWRDIPVEEQA